MLLIFRALTIRGMTSGQPTPGEIQLQFGLRYLFRAHLRGPGPCSCCSLEGLALAFPPGGSGSMSTSAPSRAAQDPGGTWGWEAGRLLSWCIAAGEGRGHLSEEEGPHLEIQNVSKSPHETLDGASVEESCREWKEKPASPHDGIFVTVITYY